MCCFYTRYNELEFSLLKDLVNGPGVSIYMAYYRPVWGAHSGPFGAGDGRGKGGGGEFLSRKEN